MAEPEPSTRSYGCQYGCGNSFDVVLTQIADNSTLILCLPCFVRTAIEIVDAMTGEISPEVEAERQELAALEQAPMSGTRARRGRHNAPVGTDSLDLIDAYDTAVTPDELGDEFK